MSIHLMDRVWWREDLRTMEKFVALALADAAGDDGACYPSIDRIAKKCSCVRRTVQVALKDLERKKLVRRYRRKDRTDFYQLVLENWPQKERPQNSLKEQRLTAAEYRASQDDEMDLFGPSGTGAGNASQPKTTGESNSSRGADKSARGAGDSPKPLEEPLEEPLDILVAEAAPVVKTREPSVIDYVKGEWDLLKQELGDNIAGCRAITDSQAKLVRERAKQHAVEGEAPIDVWRTVFSEIRRSRFLRGEAPPGFNRQKRFRLSLTDLLKPHIFTKVVNGKYADTEADNRGFDPSTGEILTPAASAVRGTIERLHAARERHRR